MKLVYKHRIIRPEHQAFHDKSMANDPIYREGFAAAERATNPHQFPKDISAERLQLSVNDKLTDDQKNRLRELGEQMDATEWDRWSHGHHARWECEFS